MSDPRPALVKAATADGVWDVVVIGGGASGLGAAVDAAARGYRTLLLEAHDYAKGTSSRSTKLIHGGVRYLAQGNISLVRESLHERGVLVRNAPHLVHDLAFLVPAYTAWRLPFYGAGLKLYDLLAGRLNLKASRVLSAKAAIARVATVRREGLAGAILYHDAQFDDARLAVTLMRTLQDAGGVALNAAPVTGLIKENGRVTGVIWRDNETGADYRTQARAVVNATGVFADAVRRMDEPHAPDVLTPSQGVHVVVPQRFLPGATALLVPRTDDGRVLFAVPWHGRTLIGTTDTLVDEAELDPRPLDAEIDFILDTAGRYLRPAPGRGDILSVFAGLRPLIKGRGDTRSLSREHEVRVSGSGLVSVLGGKWTTYRRMGQDAIDQAARTAGLPARASRTETLRLHGSDASAIAALPGADVPVHPDFRYHEADVRWAVRHEQARTVEDILARRLRILFLDARAAVEAAPRVAAIMAEELGQDTAWQARQVYGFTRLAAGYRVRFGDCLENASG